MADMHIIEGRGKGRWQVAMHFDVPNINNAVAVNYRTALVNSGRDLTSVLAAGDGLEGTISTAEAALLASGTLFEVVVALDLEGPGTTNASRIALLQEQYAVTEAETIGIVQGRLRYFGHNQVS